MIASASWAAGAALALASLAACGHGGDARFPERPPGCQVRLFHETPDVPAENIGPVQARCSDEVPAADCVRTLEDQVCALGGDVVWGVGEPEHTADGKNHYYGRAAHTKAPRAHKPDTPR